MNLPSLPPPLDRFSRRQLALLGGGCAAVLVAVVCIVVIVLRGGLIPGRGEQATAETAETAATAETAETAETAPREADLAVQNAAAGTVLDETPDAGRSYVEETLFIGDSNTARYLMYADETGQAFTTLDNNIGVVSMGVGSITSLECEKFKGYSGMYTVPESVAMLKPKRIIICYGTNNLSGSSTDATNFIKTYLQGLQAIEEAWPYCDIIVSAIPPLDRQRENTNLTMTQVDAYNAALVKMCEENGYKFLNSAEVLRDETTGWAKTDYTLSDGVHLSKDAVTAYFQYVRTHAYITEDRRPQPLGTIPTPDGVPANLISEDPIAVRGAKVPLEFVATNGGKLSGATSQLVKKGGTASAVTAIPNEGFVFAGWTASTGGSYSSATIQFTMPANANAGGVVLTAHFTPDAHEHDYVLVEGSETPATCLYAGSAKYACSICGEVIEKDTPALGHDWDGGSQNGDTITYTCRRCGETKSEQVAHTHNFTKEAGRKDPTCTEGGYVVWQCSCGQQTTETIGALGHSGVTQEDGSVVCSRCGTLLQAASPNPGGGGTGPGNGGTDPGTGGTDPGTGGTDPGTGGTDPGTGGTDPGTGGTDPGTGGTDPGTGGTDPGTGGTDPDGGGDTGGGGDGSNPGGDGETGGGGGNEGNTGGGDGGENTGAGATDGSESSGTPPEDTAPEQLVEPPADPA